MALAEARGNQRKVALMPHSSLVWVLPWLFALLIWGGLHAPANAQFGSYLVPAKPQAPPSVAGANAGAFIHRNAIGKPCLDYDAMSRAHTINPDIVDNVVSVNNQCAQRINVRICYFNTESCLNLELSPFQRKDVILGIGSKGGYFRYSYREKM